MNTASRERNTEIMTAYEAAEKQPIVTIGNQNTGMVEQRPVGAIKVAVERNEAKIFQRLKVIASAAGDDFYYRFPVKAKNDDGTYRTDWIEGPSIKCALAVARSYGNCDIDVRTQDGPEHWTFYARFLDFETGFSMTRAYQQRKSQKAMKTDRDRQLDIVYQIGQSKAIRNVICNAIATFTDFAFIEAQNAIIDKVGKNLESYRKKVLARLAEMKVDVKRVEMVAGRSAPNWLAPDVARIIAELQSVNDGMATLDELYPSLEGEEPKTAEPEPQRSEPEPKASETKPQEPEKKLSEEEQREVDRRIREEIEGPQHDEWDDYLDKMFDEAKSARNKREQNEVNAAFRDNVAAALKDKRITEARVKAVLQAWEATTGLSAVATA